MKKHILALLAISIAVPTIVSGADKVKIVKTSGFDRKVTYEIKNPGEFKSLSKQVQNEGRLHKKALDSAKKAWAADAENRRGFPGAAVTKRSAKQVGKDYTDRNVARKKLYRLQDKDVERKRDDAIVQGKIYRRMRKAEGLTSKQKPKAQIAAEEKEALQKKARDLFCAKLFELIQGGK